MYDLTLFDDPRDIAEHSQAVTTAGRTAVRRQLLTALRAASVTNHSGEFHVTFPPMAAEDYASLKHILASAGVLWNAKKKTHVGSLADREEFELIVESGTFYDSKHALEFFATSQSGAQVIARLVSEEVGYLDQPKILEPSAGDRTIVGALLDAMPHLHVTAIEFDPRRARILRTRFKLDPRVRIIEADTLAFHETGWDAVAMNPPFANALAHIQHGHALVKPFGHVIGIASLARNSDRELAQWLHDRDAWTDETDRDTFVDTTFHAAFFGMRAETSWYERMRDELTSYHLIEPQMRALTVISRDLHTLAIDSCNGVIEEDDYDRRLDQLLTDARRIVNGTGIAPSFAGDPRAGHGLRLRLPNGHTNDWGQSGIIVPNAIAEFQEAHKPHGKRGLSQNQIGLELSA